MVSKRGHSVIGMILVEGFVRMMNQDHFIGPVNIGNPGEFTIRELAELVLQMTGFEIQLDSQAASSR